MAPLPPHTLLLPILLKQKPRQIDRTFPRLEAALVNTRRDIVSREASYQRRIFAAVFGHDLSADIEEFAAGESDAAAMGCGDAEGGVGDLGGECGELLWRGGLTAYRQW